MIAAAWEATRDAARAELDKSFDGGALDAAHAETRRTFEMAFLVGWFEQAVLGPR